MPAVRQRAKATLASVLKVTCDRGGSQLDGGLGNVQLLDSPESAMVRRKMGMSAARGNETTRFLIVFCVSTKAQFKETRFR